MSNAGWIFYLQDGSDRYVVHVSEPDRQSAVSLIPAHLQSLQVTMDQTMGKSLNDFLELKPGKTAVGKFEP